MAEQFFNSQESRNFTIRKLMTYPIIEELKKGKFGMHFKTRSEKMAVFWRKNDIYLDNPYQNHYILYTDPSESEENFIYCNDFGHTSEHVEGLWLEESPNDIIGLYED